MSNPRGLGAWVINNEPARKEKRRMTNTELKKAIIKQLNEFRWEVQSERGRFATPEVIIVLQDAFADAILNLVKDESSPAEEREISRK